MRSQWGPRLRQRVRVLMRVSGATSRVISLWSGLTQQPQRRRLRPRNIESLIRFCLASFGRKLPIKLPIICTQRSDYSPFRFFESALRRQW